MARGWEGFGDLKRGQEHGAGPNSVFNNPSIDGEQIWRTRYSTYGLKALRKENSDPWEPPQVHQKQGRLTFSC